MDGIINSPDSAGFPDAEMEFVEVTNRVLLVLPVCSIFLGAESTKQRKVSTSHTTAPQPQSHLNPDSSVATLHHELPVAVLVHSIFIV